MALVGESTIQEVYRNGMAERFGIGYIRVVDGLIFVGEGEGGARKWYKPEQAAALADQINAFAKGIYALEGPGNQTFRDACELAGMLAEAAQKAHAERELSKGTGNKTEIVTKQLTPLPGHVLDWEGSDRKVLDGMVELAAGMFKDLDTGVIGDVLRMSDVGGERKLGALKILDQFKQHGKILQPRAAVSMYDDIKAGRIVLPSSMGFKA